MKGVIVSLSGIALIFKKNKLPVDSIVLNRMMAALAHRGPDGSHGFIDFSLGLGHQHFWVTPEEVGEQQPLIWNGLTIAFDGRLDNREELLSALNLDTVDDRQLSDAVIVLRAYRQWGKSCFGRLLGPFTVVIYDQQQQQIVCARDPLGDRTLYYFVNRDTVLIASEECALLTHTAVSSTLDEDMAIHYFAVKALSDGRTLFADIKEVPQGTTITFSREGSYVSRYWDFAPTADIRYASDAEYAEHFLTLLKESVRSRVRATTPISVLMSGGLDSTSVAAVAAGMLSTPPTTASWVYTELEGPDERVYIDACNAHLQTTPLPITADDAWPLVDFDSWPVNINHPYCDPYERLSERTYAALAEHGIRPLLTGVYADQMYGGADYSMLELLREGRVWETAVQWRYDYLEMGLRYALVGPSSRRLARAVLNRVPGGQRLRPIGPFRRPWLTVSANERLQTVAACSPPLSKAVRRPDQFHSIFNALSARVSIAKATEAARFAIDLRHPFRDRRLIEFALAIPAHQFDKRGMYKYVARQAMQNLLPDQVRLRTHISTFMQLFMRGLAERELSQVRKTLGKTNAMWSKFVDPTLIPLGTVDELQDHMYKLSDAELLIVWFCVSFELWREKVELYAKATAAEPIMLDRL